MSEECWWCGRKPLRSWELNGQKIDLCDLCVPHVFAEIRRRGLLTTLVRDGSRA